MPSSSRSRKNKRAKAADTESRTSAVGRKRSRPVVRRDGDSQQPVSKRRKLGGQARVKKSKKQASAVGAENLRDFVSFSSLLDTEFAQTQTDSDMPSSSFGRNRLRSGFLASRRMQRSASHPGTPSDSDANSATGPVAHDLETEDDDGGMTLNVDGNDHAPIVISDDDEGEADEASVDDNDDDDDQMDEDGSIEEGEEREDSRPNKRSGQNKADRSKETSDETADGATFIVDPTSSGPQLCLKDLNPEQLESQIKYAFWQLQRDQIDLSRPARCLHCQEEGHIDDICPKKTCSQCGAYGQHNTRLCPNTRRCETCRQPGHASCTEMRNTTIPCDLCSVSGHSESTCPLRHYPERKSLSDEKLQMWISCCHCASKSHIVGDCPKMSPSEALRWSLRHLKPEQVVNLSIQTNSQKLEREAQDRGMRPEGLKIRGRANQFRPDSGRRNASDSDDLENFLSHPPATRSNRRPAPSFQAVNQDHYRPSRLPPSDPYDRYDPYIRRDEYDDYDRYDRYAAPNGPESYRPPRNAYYATDSFGRSRSRSPPGYGYQSHHPPGRSPSPVGTWNSYRPDDRSPGGRYSPPAHSRAGLPPRPPATSKRPGPGTSLQLPTRKGSNTSLKGAAPSSLPSKPSQPGSSAPTGKKRSNIKTKAGR